MILPSPCPIRRGEVMPLTGAVTPVIDSPPGLDCLEGCCGTLIPLLEGRFSSIEMLLHAALRSAPQVEMSCVVEAHQLALGVCSSSLSPLLFSLALPLGGTPEGKEALASGKSWLARIAGRRSLIFEGKWDLARSASAIGRHQLLRVKAEALDDLVVFAADAIVQVAEVPSLLEIDQEGQQS